MSEPRPPVAPVIRTVRSGSRDLGAVNTTLPTFLPSRRWRKASGAWRMSQLRSGEWRSSPRSISSATSPSISPMRFGPASPRSKGR